MKNIQFQQAILRERRGPNDNQVQVSRIPQNPRYGANTLNEYRSSYPGTAPVPTITQSGLIGELLARGRRRALSAARRRAMLERVVTVAVDVLHWLRNPLGVPTPAPIPQSSR